MATRVTAPLSSLLLLLLGCGAAGAAGAACSNATLLAAQLDALLAEYERGAAPAARLPVQMALDMRHATVDERASTVRLLAELRLSWLDPRVAWNATSWGCDGALVPAERLWLPDVAPVSAATRGAEAASGERARVSSAGLVTWSSRVDLSAPVALRLEAWPRDVQTVVFKFASRDHDSEQLNLTISDAKYALMFESGGWELARVSHAAEERAGGGGGARRVAAWTVALRRRAPAQLLATRAVLAAAALLALSAGLLPPVDRPPLFACASFTAALWLIAALVRLPASATCPRVLRALGALCACGGGAAACAALVRRVAGARAAPPRLVRSAVTAASAFCNLMPEQCSGEVGAWAAAAQLLDYALLSILLLAIFIIICISL